MKRKVLISVGVAVLISGLLLVFLGQEVPRWERDWREFDCGEKTMTIQEARDWLWQEYEVAIKEMPGEGLSTAKVIPVVVPSEKAAEMIPECVGGWPIQVVICDSATWRSETATSSTRDGEVRPLIGGIYVSWPLPDDEDEEFKSLSTVVQSQLERALRLHDSFVVSRQKPLPL